MCRGGRPGVGAKTVPWGIVGLLILIVGCGSPVYSRTPEAPGSGGRRAIGGTGLVPGSGAPTGEPGTGGTRTGTGGMGGAGGIGTGGVTCLPGIGGAGGAAEVSTDGAQYHFEANVQSWQAGVGSPPFTTIAPSTAQRFAGQSSLAGSITATAPAVYILEVDPAMPAIAPSTIVTFHVYVPEGAAIAWVQPYVQDSTFAFTGTYGPVACLTRGGWTSLPLTVPPIATAIGRMGVQFYVTAAWTGTVHLDSISW
jgi:hypothetical protein